LRVKLRHLDASNAERRTRAAVYDRLLRGVATPLVKDWAEHVYHLYVVQAPDRDQIRSALAEQGIGTDVHYPAPSHLQAAYADRQVRPVALPVTEMLAQQVLSLPIFPELAVEQVERVAQAVSRLARRAA
jgi:dTDP-4-amino-4,6-dideoxygalactose transaminase